ncbi:fatty acid transporter-like protein [Plenodomus tracheiphilus IPT5]|uniref:Very long-chain fatty acid transport protein n=1 Tax=Plenodomus tracheiphilus IPT5 TaxID=1408161 RepID=A0A6A7AZR5_9PLEO|nr:fatty acid transporter-like protein [Plenodomus tracheiphilus IPT5]
MSFLPADLAIAPVAGAIAGVSAAAAYIEAKYHITKDIGAIRDQKAAQRALDKNAKPPSQSLWYQFEAQVRRLPAQEEAIWSRNGCYTWAETYANACRYGQYLQREGVQSGKLFAMYMMNRPEFIFMHLGSWSIGSAPAWINYNLAGDALVHCLKVSEAKVLIVDEDAECRKRIEDIRDRLEGDLGMEIRILDAGMKGEISRMEPVRPGDEMRVHAKGKFPLFLFYTSGTTGHPKACPFETQRAAGLTNRVNQMKLKPGPNGDRWYVCMPLYHGTGGTTALVCMVTGLTCCIGTKFSTSRFWTDVRDSNSTAIVYVGETARYLINAPPSPLDRQHKVRGMFGNGLRPDVWHRFVDRFGIELVGEFFNSTEGVMVLFNGSRGPFTATSVGHQGLIARWKTHNVYVPVQVDMITGALLRDPKTGFCKRKSYEEGSEILVAMPHESAFVGYYNNPEATESRFERNVFKKGDLYYRTGDALRRDKEGRWFFLDRLGDTFRWKSENVSTAEVSEALGSFPGLLEANVYGVEVPGHDGRAGCAAILIDPAVQNSFDFHALLKHAQSKLPRYAVPVFLRVQKQATTMHNNKQNKVPLRNDGIDLRKIMERADKEAQEKGEAAVYDTIYWHHPALSQGKGKAAQGEVGYDIFTIEDWDRLKGAAEGGAAKL